MTELKHYVNIASLHFAIWSKSMELFKPSLKEYVIFLVIKVTLKISLPPTQE